MKFWKHTLISALAFIGVSSTVLYTACEKDSCLTLKCRNGGVCTDGLCQCPQGFEGSECTLHASERFIGAYRGSTVVDNREYYLDSAVIEQVTAPDVVAFHFWSEPKKIYQGRVEGSYLKVKDESTGEYFQLTEDKDRIIVFIEKTVDGKKQVINFDGYLAK